MPRFVWIRVDAGGQGTLIPPAHAVPGADARQDRRLLLQKWQESVEHFHRDAGIGLMIVLIGVLGIPFALAAMFGHSALAGFLALVACGLVVFAGYFFNARHARKTLRCPQCGRYAVDDSALKGRVPFLSTLEFQDGSCVHCGFRLTVD